MNYNECISYINSLENGFNKGLLENTIKDIKYLFNFKKISISGAIGKTSTASFLSNLLAYKHNVGVFNFKYFNSLNECISINTINISNDEFLKVFNIVYDFISNNSFKYSKQEFLFIMAYVCFSIRGVQYAVIISRDDIFDFIDYDLSIITNISDENYNKYLKIKSKKLIYTSSDKYYHLVWAYNLINNIDSIYVSKREIYTYETLMCSFVYNNIAIDLNMIGRLHAINATLAIKAIEYFDIDIKIKKIKRLLEEVFIKGILERVYIDPVVLIDEGINIFSVLNQIETIKKYNNIKVIYSSNIFNKNIIDEYEKIASQIAFTSYDDNSFDVAKKMFDECKIPRLLDNNYELLIKKIINESNKSDLILITGDFEFVKIIRKIFRG